MAADRIAVSSEPYDPYISPGASSNPSGTPAAAGNSKTAAIQAQIDDTVGIMRENITKVAERGERLDALQDKTGRSCRSYDREISLFGSVFRQSRCIRSGVQKGSESS